MTQEAGRPLASGVGFVGFRTDRFDEMVSFFAGVLGLEPLRTDVGAAWFRLGGGELHLYDVADPDHAFFDTGPVVGLVVDDVDALRGRMQAVGIEFIGEIQRAGGASWNHFRAPDGTVMEIIDRRG